MASGTGQADASPTNLALSGVPFESCDHILPSSLCNQAVVGLLVLVIRYFALVLVNGV